MIKLICVTPNNNNKYYYMEDLYKKIRGRYDN